MLHSENSIGSNTFQVRLFQHDPTSGTGIGLVALLEDHVVMTITQNVILQQLLFFLNNRFTNKTY